MKRNGYDNSLQWYFQRITHCHQLSRDEERRLIAEFQRTGSARARDQIIESALKVVVKLAFQYKGYGCNPEDLVGCGNIGLLEALDRFDLSKDVRFGTYSGWWVRAMMLQFIIANHSIVQVSSGPAQSKIFFRLRREEARARAELGSRLGSEVDLDALLAKRIGVKKEQVQQVREHISGDVQLDAPVFREGEVSVLDRLIASDGGDSVEDEDLRQQQRKLVMEAFQELTAREQWVIYYRFLRPSETQTLAEIAKELGCSRERVRQVESKALDKLRLKLQRLTQRDPVVIAA